MSETVRWSLVVSRETDISLRTHLAQKGMRKGDLSKFVESAVRRQVMNENLDRIRERNKKYSTEEIEARIDEAVTAVRAEARRKAKAKKTQSRR